MKRILAAICFTVLGSIAAFGQASVFPQNSFYGGPSSGGAGFPSPRAIVGADLPNPSGSTLGGIESLTCASHQWLNTISTVGVPTCSQPSFADISSSLACSQQPAFTGDTASPAGSCTTTTVKVNGVAFGTSPSTDTIPVITAANTSTYTALPNCTAGILQYATATHLFSCGAAGAGTVTSATIAPGTGISVTGTCTITISGTCTVAINQSVATNSLGADVLMNNTPTYFDGPSVAQGTVGTWLATGKVTMLDTTATASFICKLWDGTTVIDSGQTNSVAANAPVTMSLSGSLATPAANIKISCRDISSTNGKLIFNSSGNSKDSTLSVHRIQ